MKEASQLQFLAKELNISTDEIDCKTENNEIVSLVLNRLGMGCNTIIDFSPIENLKELQRLEFHGYELKDVSFLLKLKNLEEFVAIDGVISNYELIGQLHELTFLQLEDNDISNSSFLGELTNLRKLVFNRNVVKDLSPVRNLKNLIEFEGYFNYTSNISFVEELHELKVLEYHSNEVSNIKPLANLKNLEYLGLMENKVHNIEAIEGLEKLKYLDLSMNKVKDITPLRKLTNLIEINLWDNLLKDIYPLEQLLNLEVLNVSINKIEDFNPLVNLKKLMKLENHGNPIKDYSFVKNIEGVDISDRGGDIEEPIKQAKKQKEYIPIEGDPNQAQYIMLNTKDQNGFEEALQQLVAFSYGFSGYEKWHLVENPIKICCYKDKQLVEYGNFNLDDLIIAAEPYDKIRPLLQKFVQNISNCELSDGVDSWLFRPNILKYASIKKEYVKYYIEYLKFIDLSEDYNESEDIDSLIEKFGWCAETLDLIIGRYIDFSGQSGSEQFIDYLYDDLGEWLNAYEENFNLFYDKFVNILGYNSYNKEWAEKNSKETFEIVFKEDKNKAEEYHQKTMQKYEGLMQEKKQLHNLCIKILEKKNKSRIEDIYDDIIKINNSQLNTYASAIYFQWACKITRPICEDVKEWSKNIEAEFKFAEEKFKISLSLAKADDEYNFPNISLERKRHNLVILYQNWGRKYLHSSYAQKGKKEKIANLEKGLKILEKGFVYGPLDNYLLMNYSCILVDLLELDDIEKQKQKYATEIECYLNAVKRIADVSSEYSGTFNNTICVYEKLRNKESCLEYLQKLLESDKFKKEYPESYFDDPDFDIVRKEPRYIELMGQYYTKLKAKHAGNKEKKTKAAKIKASPGAKMEYYILNENFLAAYDHDTEMVAFDLPNSITHSMLMDRDYEAIGEDLIEVKLNPRSGEFYADFMIRSEGVFLSDSLKTKFDELGVEMEFCKPVVFIHKKLPQRKYWMVFFEEKDCMDVEKTLALPYYKENEVEFNKMELEQGPFIISDEKFGSYYTGEDNITYERRKAIEIESYGTNIIINEALKKELDKLTILGLEIYNIKDFEEWEGRI